MIMHPTYIGGGSSSKEQPDTRDAQFANMAHPISICRDVYDGTLQMRRGGERYLPRFEMEESGDYRKRLAQAVLFNAFKRSVKALTGIVFRKPLALGDDVPVEVRGQEAADGKAAVAGHWENIDNAGSHGDVFVRDIFEGALIDGVSFIFVDMPTRDPEIRSLADERRLAPRPYWISIPASQVLRARSVNVNGRVVLARFAYMETTTEDEGRFNQRAVTRVRDYALVDGTVWYTLFTQRGDKGWDEEGPFPMSIDRIPAVPCYSNRTGFFQAEPPLLDLALENIDHYQTRSDRKNVLHIASVPVPIIVGDESDESDGTVTVGVNHGIKLAKGGNAFYMEAKGGALEHSRNELQDIEQRMAALGLSMLQRQSRAAETAEAKRIDKSESDSQLAAAARGCEDAVEAALELHARWLGLADGGSVEVNKDFDNDRLDAQTVQVLASLVPDKISLDTLWDILQAGEILPDTFNAEIERDRIESQSAAGLESLLRLSRREREAA